MKKHEPVVYPEFSVMTAWCQRPGTSMVQFLLNYSANCDVQQTFYFPSSFGSQHFLKMGPLFDVIIRCKQIIVQNILNSQYTFPVSTT